MKKIGWLVVALLLGISILLVMNIYFAGDKNDNGVNELGDGNNSQVDKLENQNDEELINYPGDGGIRLWHDETNLIYSGSIVDCYISFSFNAEIGELKEISVTYFYDDGLELVDIVVCDNNSWSLSRDNNTIKLVTDNFMSNMNNFVYFRFKVKDKVSSSVLSMWLKDIIVVGNNNKKFSLNDFEHRIILNRRENYKYEKDDTKDVFVFYKYDIENNKYNEINRYECVAVSCFEYATQYLSFIDNFSGNMLIVKEVNNSQHFVLIDYEKGVIGAYKSIYYGLYNRGVYGNPSYLVVETFKGEKQIISPYTGEVISDITDYDLNVNMRYSTAYRFYSLEKGRMVVSKNGMWGIIDMTSGDVVVEFKYDDIKIFDDYRYGVLENDKWYLYEFKNNTKKNDDGYDEIFYLDSEKMFVQEDNYLYIKDLDGNNIVDDKIEIFVDYEEFACCAMQSGVRIDVLGADVDIYIDTKANEDNNYDVYHYKYNGMNKSLEKID